jgi:hypothetical protein
MNGIEMKSPQIKKFALAVLLAGAVVLPAAAADISGSWTVVGEIIGNPVNMKCAFTQDGAKVAGTCGAAAATGSVAADKVTFQHTVQRDQAYELTYSGTLDATGTTIKGEIAVMGVTGTFTATKDAAASPEFGGNWTFTGDVVGNAISMKCAFKRDGDKLSGTCTYQEFGARPTTGTVAGDKVTFQNQVQREEAYDLTYNGSLDASGSSMKGDIAVAGVTGTFSGTKDK